MSSPLAPRLSGPSAEAGGAAGVEAAARALAALGLGAAPGAEGPAATPRRRRAPSRRRLLGAAFASRPLPPRTTLLRGSDHNAGRLDDDVAARVVGLRLSTFSGLRRALWRAVAASPHAALFSAADGARMRRGCPPTAPRGQWVGSRRAYELHHVRPLRDGGAVYDLANLTLVTPRYHLSVLAPRYHFGPSAAAPPPP